MAARKKQQQPMLQAGASDSEDDLATATANGARRTTKASMSTAKPATKRKAAAPKQPRQPLKDRTNMRSDAENINDDEDETIKPKAKRPRTGAAPKHQAKKPKTLGVIPETQPEPLQSAEDVEISIEGDATDLDETQAPMHVQRVAQKSRAASVQAMQSLPPLQPRPSARSASAQPGYPPPRERSGSVSGTERERRGGDPELRRNFNEINKKYESLRLKYRSLEEVGKSGAETNFEKLKRATDDKTKTANDVIASLQKEIAELRKVPASNTAESAALQKQITVLTASNDRLTNETSTLKEKMQTSQNEVKSLEAKLVAARQQLSSGTQDSKIPTSSSTNRNAPAANATEAQREAKMKENLYSDLTGLIVRGVKRKEGEDQYDCIQTGRNGTLHFHLSIATDTSTQNPKTPTGLSYEEAEFAYDPFLDTGRDRNLLDLLPDYLTEEIAFPRKSAVKFYTKILESMTKNIVLEEAEAEAGQDDSGAEE